MTNNEELKKLASEHKLSREQISKITFSCRNTVDKWFQNKWQIPNFKLFLIKASIFDKIMKEDWH